MPPSTDDTHTMKEPMSEIRSAVILNMFLLRQNWLIQSDNFSEMEKLSVETYHLDSRFHNYCDTLMCLIYSQIHDLESDIARLENEKNTLKAELDGADKVISNLKSK